MPLSQITRRELLFALEVAQGSIESADPTDTEVREEWAETEREINAALEANSLAGLPLAIEELEQEINRLEDHIRYSRSPEAIAKFGIPAAADQERAARAEIRAIRKDIKKATV